VLQSISQTNPIGDLAPEVVVPVSRNKPPISRQLTQNLLGPNQAPLLRLGVTSWQIHPARTPDEKQVSGVVDSMSVHGDMTGCVTG